MYTTSGAFDVPIRHRYNYNYYTNPFAMYNNLSCIIIIICICSPMQIYNHMHLFPSTAPTGPPTGVNTTTSGSSITVHWSPVPCLQRNSQIIGYIVRYSEVTSSRATSVDIFVAGGSATSAIISGLQGSTHYSIDVAAVGAGEGVFSDPVTADASEFTLLITTLYITIDCSYNYYCTASKASATSSNATFNTIMGAVVAIVVLVVISVIVPVIIWLVLKHRRAVMSLQKRSR